MLFFAHVPSLNHTDYVDIRLTSCGGRAKQAPHPQGRSQDSLVGKSSRSPRIHLQPRGNPAGGVQGQRPLRDGGAELPVAEFLGIMAQWRPHGACSVVEVRKSWLA